MKIRFYFIHLIVVLCIVPVSGANNSSDTRIRSAGSASVQIFDPLDIYREFNGQGVEEFDPWDIESGGRVRYPEPKVLAVVVGIAKYKNGKSLNFTDDDAYRVYAFLKSPEGGAIPDRQIKLLIDEEATRDNILNAMNQMFSAATKHDMILFFFSGHGAPGMLFPHDVSDSATVLLNDEIVQTLRSSPARYKLCIVDACHSGTLRADSATVAAKGSGNDAIRNYYDALRKSKGGMVLLSSSKPEEKSIEYHGRRQGIFSYYLIKGLKGEADTDRNKIITIGELFDYVRINVETATNNLQQPVLHGVFDRNMPIGVVR